GGADADRLFVERDHAAHRQPRLVADQLQLVDPDQVVVERYPNRLRVANRVVEQAHVDAVDGTVDHEVIDVGEVAGHVNRPARYGGGVGGQPRHEQPHVRIE